MNRVRCTACQGYFQREEAFWSSNLQRICSERCFQDWEAKKRAKIRNKRRAAYKAATKAPVELRFQVKERDGYVCRWCLAPGAEVHHIVYRSQGGRNEPHNLIFLCNGCHARAHSSKQAFQPLLLAYIWLFYAEGKQLTIPQIAHGLDRLGLLTELQQERLAS